MTDPRSAAERELTEILQRSVPPYRGRTPLERFGAYPPVTDNNWPLQSTSEHALALIDGMFHLVDDSAARFTCGYQIQRDEFDKFKIVVTPGVVVMTREYCCPVCLAYQSATPSANS